MVVAIVPAATVAAWDIFSRFVAWSADSFGATEGMGATNADADEAVKIVKRAVSFMMAMYCSRD